MSHDLALREPGFLRAFRTLSFSGLALGLFFGSIFILVFSLIFGVPSAKAHRLGVSTKVKKNEISVYVSYGKNSPCKGCRVKATDGEEVEVFSGQTDERGYAVFTPKSIKGGLTIVARDSMGHRRKRRISPAKLNNLQPDGSDKEADTTGVESATAEKVAQASISVMCNPSESSDTKKMNCKMDSALIAAMIKKEVENRIKPEHIQKKHGDEHPHSHEADNDDHGHGHDHDHSEPGHLHERSFNIRDVIAGLGFIFGLAGFIIAVTKKKKS